MDLLVDGEQYRGDMVAYFADEMEGFAIAGLVRSYGNRYYPKPVVVGPVGRRHPVTVERSEERRVGKECRGWRWMGFSSRRRHTRSTRDWSSDVCSSDLNRPPWTCWWTASSTAGTWWPISPMRWKGSPSPVSSAPTGTGIIPNRWWLGRWGAATRSPWSGSSTRSRSPASRSKAC